MINHIWAILWKQFKDTIKNKEILIQFVMLPCMAIIMENSINIEGMPKHFFANLFAVMYVGMAPLTSMAAIIAEEKEKNTLRVLQMCNVRAFEYLIGNAIYIMSACMAGSLIIGLAGGYSSVNLLYFMLIMFLGHGISTVLGAAVGVISNSQMAATSMTVPVMIVLSFLPMISMFNDTVKNISRFVFSQQLNILISNLNEIHIQPENIIILMCNALVITGGFVVAYRRVFVRNRDLSG